MIIKTIEELPLLTSPSSVALLPVEDGDTTYKFELNNIAKTTNQGKILPGNVSGNIFYIEGKAGTGTTRQGNVQRLVMGESSLALYDANLANEAWRLNIPVSVNQGGTGATTATEARANLEVPRSTNDVQMQFSRSNSSGQHYFISGIAGTNSSYADKRILLFSTDTGFSCYNSTDGTTIWNFKAVGLQDAVKDSFRFVHLQAANQSITGGVGNNITVSLPYTIPDGFSGIIILEAWPDYTGTSSGAGMPYVHSCNHWTTASGTATTSYVQFVNLSSSAVKFTAHALVGMTRTSY